MHQRELQHKLFMTVADLERRRLGNRLSLPQIFSSKWKILDPLLIHEYLYTTKTMTRHRINKNPEGLTAPILREKVFCLYFLIFCSYCLERKTCSLRLVSEKCLTAVFIY